MFSVLTKDLDYAVQIFKELKPDASKMAVSGFRTKAKNHLKKDYSGARGLKVFGLSGCKCVPALELLDYECDELGVEVEYAVIVDDKKGGLRFDSSELLMYNTFTRDMAGIKARHKQLQKQHAGDNHATT